MDGPETGPFNVGNPTEFTMLELAEVVKEVVNPDVTIEFRENTVDDPSRRKPDITKVGRPSAVSRKPRVLQPYVYIPSVWNPGTPCLKVA